MSYEFFFPLFIVSLKGTCRSAVPCWSQWIANATLHFCSPSKDNSFVNNQKTIHPSLCIS